MTFWREASPEARKALVAASMGWLLDAFDVMLYALILTSVIEELGLSRAQGGLMASLTLGASAVGGLVFGIVADKLGRTRALSLSILLYRCSRSRVASRRTSGSSRPSASCSASAWAVSGQRRDPRQRNVAGATSRQGLGIMQSCWAIGYGLAAVVVAIVLPTSDARVFFVGILPALSRSGFGEA